MGGKFDNSGRSATKDQLRVAQYTHHNKDDEDRGQIRRLIDGIVETTRCTHEEAELALFDAGNDVQVAVNKILESSNLDTWSHQKNKKDKKKLEAEEKKAQNRNGQYRRGPRPQNGNGEVPKPTKFNKGNAEGTENKPFQPRKPRPQGERNLKKGEKEEVDDSWSGPRVFQRTDVVETKAQPVVESSQPQQPVCAAGPLSFAAIAARAAKKETPKIDESPEKLEEFEELQPESPESVVDSSVKPEIEVAKSPVKTPKVSTPNPATPHNTPADTVNESLTDKLKNDLGLGSSVVATESPVAPPKFECVSDVSKEVVFDFAGDSSSHKEVYDRQPESVSKVENHAPLNESASRVPHNVIGQYTHSPSQQNRQQSSNQARSATLSFTDTSSVNYHPQVQDVRANGAHPSPVKPQTTSQPPPVVQPLSQGNVQPAQPTQTSQSHQQQQQQAFIPPVPQLGFPNFGYMGMYNPYQYPALGQMDFNALGMMPGLTVTSAGPMPAVQSHHQQNQHQVQQSGHQRSDYFSDVSKYNASTQSNGANNQNQTSALTQSQQRQPILDNNSQTMSGASQVGPPPGFAPANLPGSAPFVPQQSLNNMFTQFQVPFNPAQMQYPFMMNQKMPQPVYQQQVVDEQDSRMNQQQKIYNQSDKYGQSNGNKDRPVGQPSQSQLSSYVPPNYNNVGSAQLLGNKKHNYQTWNS
uniref:Ubiquitin-associated protein 2 n=1 Tax=Bursaphelenchus xylophilus TaxID=6326 RepID=A0A1I7RKZ6_BURXY